MLEMALRRSASMVKALMNKGKPRIIPGAAGIAGLIVGAAGRRAQRSAERVLQVLKRLRHRH